MKPGIIDRIWRQDAILQRLVANSAVLFSGSMAAVALGFLSMVLTARALGAEQFGVLVLITTYALLVDSLLNFQSWQALIKYGSELLENEQWVELKALLKFGYSLDIVTAISGALVACTAIWYIGEWQGWDQKYVAFASAYSLTIAFNIKGAPIAVLRLFNRFKLVAYQNVIAATIKLFGVVLVQSLDAGLWAFVAVWACADILGKLLLLVLAGRELAKNNLSGIWASDLRGISQRFIGLWSFVWTTNFSGSIKLVSREADVLFVASALGPAAVGLYKVAKQFSAVIMMGVDPAYQAIYPELAKLAAQAKRKEFVSLCARSASIVGLLALLIWGVVIVFAEPILHLTVGSEYLKASGILGWYMLAIVVAAVSFPLQPAMLALGRPGTSLFVLFVSSIVHYLVLFFALDVMGLIGAGVAYLTFYCVWAATMTGLVRHYLAKSMSAEGAGT